MVIVKVITGPRTVLIDGVTGTPVKYVGVFARTGVLAEQSCETRNFTGVFK